VIFKLFFCVTILSFGNLKKKKKGKGLNICVIAGAIVTQELGVRLVIGRLPVQALASTVSVVVSLGKTLYPLSTGGGQRARWRQCPAASPLSVCPRVAVATT